MIIPDTQNNERKIFSGATSYYAKYRPWYPEEMFAYLRKYFLLNGKGKLLDLGCGTGQILLPRGTIAGRTIRNIQREGACAGIGI